MMPELPRRLVPDEAVSLIREWIAQMKAPVKQASRTSSDSRQKHRRMREADSALVSVRVLVRR